MKNSNFIVFSLLVVLNLISYACYSQESGFKTYIVNQHNKVLETPYLIAESEKSNHSVINETEEGSSKNIIIVKQIGNNNNVGIVKNEIDSQNIEQIGNNNYYNYINYYNNTPLNLNVLQQGDSNSLQVYGRNSIIDKMSIVQKSNFKTVIVKNY